MERALLITLHTMTFAVPRARELRERAAEPRQQSLFSFCLTPLKLKEQPAVPPVALPLGTHRHTSRGEQRRLLGRKRTALCVSKRYVKRGAIFMSSLFRVDLPGYLQAPSFKGLQVPFGRSLS